MAITNDFFAALNDPNAAMWSAGVAFNRSNPLPLDKWSVFQTMDEAVTYAESNAVAYPGQLIAVYDADSKVMTAYILQESAEVAEGEAAKLEPVAVGTTPVGDESTIVVAEDGTVSLAGISGLAFKETNADGEEVSVTYQPLLTAAGLTWVKPSATTVEGLATEIEGLKARATALESAVGDANGGLVKGVADNAAAIEAIEDKIGDVAEDKTVVEMIADAQAAATYDDTDVKASIKANADAIDAIEADYLKTADKYDDTELAGRVKAIEDDYLTSADMEDLSDAIDAAEESAVNRVLGYLAEEVINEKYDTLKEVAAWIESDTTASAQLVTRVSDIEKDYLKSTDKEGLEGAIDALGDYIGDIPEDAEATTVVGYVQEVVDGLNIGDYAKASDLSDLDDRVEVVEGKAHEHGNGTILDAITAEQVAAWDAAEDNAKDYADGLNESLIEALNKKVEVADGKSLIADTLIAKIEGVEEGAQVNAIDSVDEAQFAIDDDKKLTLLGIAMDKVTGLGDALAGKADKGTTLAAYGITDVYTKTETEARLQEVIDGLSDTSETAATVAQDLKTYKTSNDQRVDTIEGKLEGIAAGAQVNVLEGVKVGGTLLEIADKAVNIPVATSTLLGVVMSSAAENKISVAADGTMEVNSLNVNKLAQTEGDTLVLDGGFSK